MVAIMKFDPCLYENHLNCFFVTTKWWQWTSSPRNDGSEPVHHEMMAVNQLRVDPLKQDTSVSCPWTGFHNCKWFWLRIFVAPVFCKRLKTCGANVSLLSANEGTLWQTRKHMYCTLWYMHHLCPKTGSVVNVPRIMIILQHKGGHIGD